MTTLATTHGRPLNDRPNSRLPRLRAWLKDWTQAGDRAEASILVGEFAGAYEAAAGVVALGTMRRGWGSTWTKAVLDLEANMDAEE